ncbi:MAG: site-specific DNA-methyltransferase [Gemmatales bacterium]|nr:site-specific DNA-methyltransferase [Gemmatales bacterium]MDW8176530.1 site-specific DNA-methyltransferase [Gemmatales bacterium]
MSQSLPQYDRIYFGDCLEVLRHWPEGFADLIYIDPPFNTGQTRRLQTIRLGRGALLRRGFSGRQYKYQIVSDLSYSDNMPLEEYLDFLYHRILEGWRILKPTGSFFLHVDPRIVHYARWILDDVFGAERFINEIIWAYDYGGRPRDRFPPKHDNILWYAKSDTWTFNVEEIERIPYMAPNLVSPDKAARGKLPTDVWWITIVPTNARERTGYPTQKPEKLLERIIRAASRPGDLVVDYFAGSGTTGAVARRLGRHWILVDINPQAVAVMQQRLAAPAIPDAS